MNASNAMLVLYFNNSYKNMHAFCAALKIFDSKTEISAFLSVDNESILELISRMKKLLNTNTMLDELKLYYYYYELLNHAAE